MLELKIIDQYNSEGERILILTDFGKKARKLGGWTKYNKWKHKCKIIKGVIFYLGIVVGIIWVIIQVIQVLNK
jgi:hypothetical protein